MSVFIHQPIRNGNLGLRCFRNRDYTHLMADSEGELVSYAKSIGLRESWIQGRGTRRAHFDLVGEPLRHVLADDKVLKLSFPDFVKRYTRGRGL